MFLEKKAGRGVCMLGSSQAWVCKPMCIHLLGVCFSRHVCVWTSTCVTPMWPAERNRKPGVAKRKRLCRGRRIVMRLQRGWEWSRAIGQERRNRFKLQEGDFRQDTSKSKWQELSVCGLSGEKDSCYFGGSLRITCLPGRTGERLVLGREMTDGSLHPFQPSQLWPCIS